MAVTYTNAAKNARMEGLRTHFANGTLVIGTAGMATTIATFTLTASAGSTTTDTWNLAFAASTVAAAAGGTAVAAEIRTSGATPDITGLTVGIGTGDIQLDNNVISAAQNVTLTSAAITHAA